MENEIRLRYLEELFLHLSENEQEEVISLIISILSKK